MFGNLERPVEVFQIEALSPNFLMRATLQPVGTLPVYLNDRHRDYLRLNQVEFEPLAAGRLHFRPSSADLTQGFAGDHAR